MGLFVITCPSCQKQFQWFSGAGHQFCPECFNVIHRQNAQENCECAICLKGKLEDTLKNIKDFEYLAIEWKRGYDQMKRNLEIKIEHLEQTIEEMENERKDLADYNESQE